MRTMRMRLLKACADYQSHWAQLLSTTRVSALLYWRKTRGNDGCLRKMMRATFTMSYLNLPGR